MEKPPFDAADTRSLASQCRAGPKSCAARQTATWSNLLFTRLIGPDSVFYLQKGRAQLTVVSKAGKEATIALFSAGEFVGEGALAAVPGLRLSTATAVNTCIALKISRDEMIRVMHQEHEFSDLFLKFLLVRSMRIQADLVDHLFNSSEKRLARILLLMAEFGKPGEPETFIPPSRRKHWRR